MKILILNNLYAPFARGGAERIIERLVEELSNQGHEALVATSLPWGQSRPSSDRTRYVRGLPSLFYHLERLPKFARLAFHLLGYVDWFAYRQTKSIISRFQPDLIISNNLIGLGMSTACATRRSKAKHIHILHDIQLLHPSGLLMWGSEGIIESRIAKCYQSVNDYYFKHANLIVSPSQWLLDLHRDHGMFKKQATMVVANPAVLGSSPRVARNSSAQVDCLFVGQLEHHKGVSLLLDAFQMLPPSFHLRIVGSGTLDQEVSKAARKDSRIERLGRLTPGQVADEINRSSLLIVPSLCYENSPTVIYEAMSQGLPVIAAELGGIPELITDKANLFVPGDAKSLVAVLTGPYAREQRLPQDKILSPSEYISRLLDKIKAL